MAEVALRLVTAIFFTALFTTCFSLPVSEKANAEVEQEADDGAKAQFVVSGSLALAALLGLLNSGSLEQARRQQSNTPFSPVDYADLIRKLLADEDSLDSDEDAKSQLSFAPFIPYVAKGIADYLAGNGRKAAMMETVDNDQDAKSQFSWVSLLPIVKGIADHYAGNGKNEEKAKEQFLPHHNEAEIEGVTSDTAKTQFLFSTGLALATLLPSILGGGQEKAQLQDNAPFPPVDYTDLIRKLLADENSPTLPDSDKDAKSQWSWTSFLPVVKDLVDRYAGNGRNAVMEAKVMSDSNQDAQSQFNWSSIVPVLVRGIADHYAGNGENAMMEEK